MTNERQDSDSSTPLRCVSCGGGEAESSLVRFWDGRIYCQACLRQHFSPTVTAWYDAHRDLQHTHAVIGSLRGVTFTAILYSAGTFVGGTCLASNTLLGNAVGVAACFVGSFVLGFLYAFKIEKAIFSRHYDRGALSGWTSSIVAVLTGGMLGILLVAIVGSASVAAAAVFAGSIVILQGLRLAWRLQGGVEVSVKAGTVSANFGVWDTDVPISDCRWYVGTFRDEAIGIVNSFAKAIVIQCGTGWMGRGWRVAVGATDESYQVWKEFLEASVNGDESPLL